MNMAKKTAAPQVAVDASAPLDPVLAALANPEVSDAPLDTADDPVAVGGGGDTGTVDAVEDADHAVAVAEEDDDGSTGYTKADERGVDNPALVNILVAPDPAPAAALDAPPKETFPEPEEPIVPTEPEAPVGVPANPAMLQWPSDQYGTCSGIKQPLLDCVGSLNGAPEKLEVFLATVQMAVEHALARFESQRVERQASLLWHQEQEAVRNGARPNKGWQS